MTAVPAYRTSFSHLDRFVRRAVTLLGTVLLVSALPATAAEPAEASAAAENAARMALEAAIIDSIQQGRNVVPLADQWRQQKGTNSTRARVTGNGHRLGAALQGLNAALAASRRGDDTTRLAAAYEEVLAADLLLTGEGSDATEKLEKAGLGDFGGRLSAARVQLRAPLDALYALIDQLLPTSGKGAAAIPVTGAARQKIIDQSLALIRDRLLQVPNQPVLRSVMLPVRPKNLVTRAPVLTPAMTPSYVAGGETAAQAVDSAAGPEAPLDDEILHQAKELGYDYVRIFEFVRNQVRSEWYAGSVRGAIGVLRTRAGNDVDQASLLVALMRASGAPARYVRGVVELDVATVANEMGLTDSTLVPGALARAGIAHTAVQRGGRVVAVQVERTWVTARVPYTNYRGVLIDSTGMTWLPLDPALKSMALQPATGILKTLPGSADTLVAEFLAAPPGGDFLTALRTHVDAGLANGQTYQQQLGSSAVVPQELGLLPGSLPYAVVAVTAESPELAADQVVKARLRLFAKADGSGAPGMDEELPLHELSNNRVTLSYSPATQEDHRVALLWGGLDLVPAYLVKVRPQLRIGGLYRGAGTDALTPGDQARLQIDLVGPFGSEGIDQVMTVGAYQAIAFGAPSVTRPATAPVGDSEHDAARLLDGVARSYLDAWTASEDEIAALLAMPVLRPLPSVLMVGNNLRADAIANVQLSAAWRGVVMDAALRVSEPVGSESDRRSWFALASLQGSSLEHAIFEQQFQVDSVSADKGLALAAAQGIALQRIDSQNVGSQLPSLAQPQAVRDDIAARVRLGHVVTIPVSPLTVNAWSGAVWRAEHPATGAAGYFISGQLAGGASSLFPWPLQFLADALANGNGEGPNNDPMAAASIHRVTATDGQKGTAGEALDNSLAVIVRDRDGRPVEGAQVTFTVVRGGGKLSGGSSLVVATTAAGYAEASLELGQKTSDNPIYLKRQASDEHPYRVGLNIVEATVASARGTLRTDEPFAGYAYPGKPAELVQTDTFPTKYGVAGLWADTATFAVRDQYQNPIANESVSFSAMDPVNTCDPAPSAAPKPAKLATEKCAGVPYYSECGSASANDKTDSRGTVSVYVFLDAVTKTTSQVKVSAGSLSKTLTYESPESCGDGPSVFVTTFYLKDEKGNNISATKVGTAYQQPVQVRFLYTEPEVKRSGDSCKYLPDRTVQPASGVSATVTVSNGGSASGLSSVGNGVYQTTITAGAAAGYNLPTLEYRATLPDPCGDSVTVSGSYPLPVVWGLDPKIEQVQSLDVPDGVDPSRIHLEKQGRSSYPVEISYAIAPKEYTAFSADVQITEGGNDFAALVGSELKDKGRAILERSVPFDINQTYQALLYVNAGSKAEVKSDEFELPLKQKLIEWTSKRARLYTDIDIVNQRACNIGSEYRFEINEAAAVTLKAYALDDATGEADSTGVTLADQDYGAGEQSILLTPGTLLPRLNGYLLELTATSLRDSSIQEKDNGHATVVLDAHDSLPVGQVVVKGVNVKSGRVMVPGQSIVAPGRGPPLAFRPIYSSGAAGAVGTLGINWTHNYEAGLSVTPCGDVVVSTGDAGSMRFLAGANNTLTPAKGYHGTLVANQTDRSFDFYSKDGTQYHFNFHALPKAWRLASITDANGNALTLTYETGLRDMLLTRVDDSMGRSLSFTYETRAFSGLGAPGTVMTKVTGPAGLSLSFAYDEFGNLVSSQKASGATETYSYTTGDPARLFRNNMASYANAGGQVTSYGYTSSLISYNIDTNTFSGPDAKVTSLTAADGGNTRFAYTPSGDGWQTVIDGPGSSATYVLNKYGSPLSITDGAGNTTMTWADDDVVMTSKTDPNGNTAAYSYDSAGNQTQESLAGYSISTTWLIQGGPPYIKDKPLSRTDRNGHTTSYGYDGQGNLVSEQRPIGSIAYAVAGNGDRLSMTDANGHTTSYRYDGYGQLEGTVDPLGGSISTPHDARGNLLSITDQEGRQTSFSYDSDDHLTGRRAPNGSRSYSHDVLGNKLSETDEEGRTTSIAYDDMNRPISIKAPAGTKSMSYDYAGNKISETDLRGNVTSYGYDGANRLTSRREPLGKTTSYSYDGNGNVLSETDANGNTTAYSYDGLNRRIGIVDANDGVTSIVVDGNGNKTSVTDAAGRVTAYSYDAMNRLLTETLDGATVTSTYDGNGNLRSRTDANGNVTRHTYDAGNRRTETRDARNGQTRYEYDRVGNLLQETNPRVMARKFSYTATNQVARRIDEEGHHTTYDYSPVGNLLSETWANGNVLTYTYDVANRRTSAADLVGTLWTATYDADGNKISETDGNGNASSHEYDALSRKTASHLAAGRNLAFGYDAAGNLTSEADANGKVTAHTYDVLRRRIRTEDSLGLRWRGGYDAVGNLTSEIDANGQTLSHGYDAHNRRTSTVDALGTRLAATYDGVGNKLTETDANGNITTNTYDAMNRLATVSRAGIRLHRYDYDEVGNLAFDTDANGNKSGYEYDGRNLRTAENLPLAAISKTSYDAMGDVLVHTDPENRKTTNAYDKRRRLVSVTNPAGEKTVQGWDGANNLVSVTRPLGNASTRGFDAANRLVAVTTAAGTARLGYDGNGNLVERTDANGNRSQYAFDARNRRTRVTYASGASEAVTYDGNGNPATLTDGRGNVIGYTYDARNRETLKSYGSGPDGLTALATTWDGNGNRTGTRIDDGQGSRSHAMSYDGFDRLVQQVDPWGKAVSHTYDAAGNRLTTTAQGATSRYSVDALGRRVATLVPGGTLNTSYDRSSLPTAILYADGTQSKTTYDAAGHIAAVEHSRNGTVFARSQYTYDANGNRIAESTTEGGQTRSVAYTFDADDRLIEEAHVDAGGSRTIVYTLDPAGNRIGETRTGSGAYAAETFSRTFTLNSRNQVVAMNQSGGATPGRTDYSYDADGHLVRVQGPTQDATYVWNVRGQLVQVLSSGSPIAGYRYDADGLREEKVAGGQTRRTLWIDGFAALDQDEAGNAQGRYEVGPNGRTPLALIHPLGNEYLHADALGSITQATAAGAVIASNGYDAWGNVVASGSSRSKFGYTGHQPDAETGLIYFKARYYDPVLGRFIGEDPMEGEAAIPLSWRSYLYANGNPLVYVDRNGNIAVLADGADALGQFNDWLKDRSSQYGDGWLAVAGNVATGVTRGIVAGTEGLVRAANFGANLVTNQFDGFGSQSLKDATVAELDKTFDSATKSYDYVVNKGGAADLAGKALDTAGKALSGDAKAIGDLTEFAVGLAGGGGAAKQGVSATARGAESVVGAAARSARSVATKVDDVVLTGEREALGVGAAGVKTTRSVEAKSGALEETTQKAAQVRSEAQVVADVRGSERGLGDLRTSNGTADSLQYAKLKEYYASLDSEYTPAGPRRVGDPINFEWANRVHPSGVRFTPDGYPDFEPYAIKRVEISQVGDYVRDFRNANIEAGIGRGSQSHYQTHPDYTWHHHQDGRTMLLVPSSIHGPLSHSGGAEIARRMGGARP